MESGSSSVDSSLAFKLSVSCPTGLSSSQVSVFFDEAYDRIPHPDIKLESSIAEVWDRKLQQNTLLFNGKKFRYAGHILRSETVGSKQESHVFLHLGLTDYRTFVGTNLSPLWENFLVPLEDDSIQCQHTSTPLGNGAVVETSDQRILVLKRSNNVGEFPGYFVFPGGHPEPQEVGIAYHDKDSVDSHFLNRKVAQEMFNSIIREVVEEIGLPEQSLCDPVFIGVSQRKLNVRPTAFFFIKCTLQSKEIQELYCGAQDGFESTQFMLFQGLEDWLHHCSTKSSAYLYTPLDDLENMAKKMPGCHQGGFSLYKLMVEALKDC